jgi:hypothetical protein
MEIVILKDMRLRTLAAAGALMVAAACGGGDDEAAAGASAAKGGDSATAAAAATTPGTAQQPQAAAPAAQSNVPAVLDSGMATPAEAAKAAPAVQGPVNVQVLNSYELSMPKLRQLVQGGRNLAALQARRPELRDSMRISSMDPNAIYDRLNSVPAAREAIASAGLSPREYAVATAALLQAAMVYQMQQAGRELPKEARVNEANVRFVGENWEEIQTMMRSAAQGQAQP